VLNTCALMCSQHCLVFARCVANVEYGIRTGIVPGSHGLRLKKDDYAF